MEPSATNRFISFTITVKSFIASSLFSRATPTIHVQSCFIHLYFFEKTILIKCSLYKNSEGGISLANNGKLVLKRLVDYFYTFCQSKATECIPVTDCSRKKSHTRKRETSMMSALRGVSRPLSGPLWCGCWGRAHFGGNCTRLH